MMDYEVIKPWEYVIAGVAREYHKKFDMVDGDDIKQACYEWFLAHPNKVESWVILGKKEMKNLIYRSLRNEALDYCQRWKAKGGGYEVVDLFYYTPEMVEAVLPTVLRGTSEVPASILNLGKTSRPSVLAEGGNFATSVAEVSSGYDKLIDEDRAILLLRFGLNYEFDEVKKELDLNTDDAARQRVRRAVKRLVVAIGGFKPFEDQEYIPTEEE